MSFIFHDFRKDTHHEIASDELKFASVKKFQRIFQIELFILVEHECKNIVLAKFGHDLSEGGLRFYEEGLCHVRLLELSAGLLDHFNHIVDFQGVKEARVLSLIPIVVLIVHTQKQRSQRPVMRNFTRLISDCITTLARLNLSVCCSQTLTHSLLV